MENCKELRRRVLNSAKAMAQNELIKNLPKWLSEDKVFDDVTSEFLGLNSSYRRGRIVFFSKSKENFLLAGADFIEAIFERVSEISRKNYKFDFIQYKKDGDTVKYKEKILEVRSNNVGFLLSIERLCLNFIMRLSAIATETHKLVDIVRNFGVQILATRKTTPGLRFLEKYAVCVGGGLPYRFDLSYSIMIKDNHIRAIGGMKNLLDFFEKVEEGKLKKMLKNGITVEVQNKKELSYALKITRILKDRGFSFSSNISQPSFIIMLDNFPHQALKGILKKIRDFSSSEGVKIFVELSGGIRPYNIELFAKLKPDAISTSYITFSPSFFPDISADIYVE